MGDGSTSPGATDSLSGSVGSGQDTQTDDEAHTADDVDDSTSDGDRTFDGDGRFDGDGTFGGRAIVRPRLPARLRRGLARVLVRGADAATRWVVRLLGESPSASRAELSEAELRHLVAHSAVLDREERRLIDDVFVAGDRHVRELMVPRTEVVFLEAAMSIEQAAIIVRGNGHSRFPVTDATQDDVVGFVHLRDIVLRPDPDPAATVGELAREVRRLPGSKRMLAALSEMRRAGDQLAVVVDEYGGTAGIVTLEDLIEELVGEIHDEYDETPEPAVAEGTRPAEVDGLLNLGDFAERAGFALPSGPYDTVGGFLMAALGRLPAVGDEVDVDHGVTGWRLRVVDLDGRRVSRVALACATAPEVVAPRGELVPLAKPAAELV